MDGSIGFSLPSQASASIVTSLEKGIAHGNTKVMARQTSMPIHVQSRRPVPVVAKCKWHANRV